VDAETLDGEWWLPEDPSRRTRGTLTIDPESALELTLQGSLKEPALGGGSLEPGDELHRVILGRTSGGRVTLTDVRGWGLGLAALPGVVGTETYSVGAALIGVHLGLDALDAISGIGVEFSGLREWLEVPPLWSMRDTLAAEDGSMTFHVDARDEVQASIPGAVCTFIVGPSVEGSRSRVVIERQAEVQFRLDEAAPIWRQFQQWVIPMRDLLSLAINRPVRIENLWLSHGDEWVRFVAPLRQADVGVTNPPIEASSAVLRFGDIRRRLDDVIADWYAVHSKVRPALDAISAVDRAPFVFAETRFSNYAGAADQVHTALIGGTAVPKDVHQQRVKSVLEVCPPHLHDWAKSVLERANGKSFRTRIEELVESAGRIGSHGLAPEPDWFANEVTQLRGRVAHGSGPGTSGVNLYWFSRALLCLIRARLLKELGIPQDQIEESLFKSIRYEGVAQEIARIRRGE